MGWSVITQVDQLGGMLKPQRGKPHQTPALPSTVHTDGSIGYSQLMVQEIFKLSGSYSAMIDLELSPIGIDTHRLIKAYLQESMARRRLAGERPTDFYEDHVRGVVHRKGHSK